MPKLLLKVLFFFFLAGFYPSIPSGIDFSELNAEQTTKKKKKKKRKKKSSSRKKSSSKKKRKKKPTEVKEEPASEPQKVESAGNKILKSKINSAVYADELYNLTGELEASNKELARATRYFYEEEPKTQEISSYSKPFFSKEDYEKEAQSNPDNLYIQRQLGRHYEANKQYEAAKEVYLRQVAKNPDNPDAHFFLGSLYTTTGEYHKAKSAFEEALFLDPNHAATIEAMTSFVNTKEQRELSQDILRFSSEKFPDGPAQKMTIIRDKMSAGEYIEALNLAEEASEMFPNQTGFIQLIGENHLKMGQTEEAKRAFQRSIKLDPKSTKSYLSLADLYFDQGKFVYAALSFGDAVYLEPDNTEYRYMMGLSYFNAQEWGRSINAWEDFLRYKPDDAMVKTLLPQAYYILAVEHNRVGNPTLGRESFKNALAINNNHHSWLPGAFSVLGKFYRDKNMHKESLVAYQEVLEIIPNDADTYMGMGITYWKMNEKQLARASWEKSLALKPNNNESQGWLILSSQSIN